MLRLPLEARKQEYLIKSTILTILAVSERLFLEVKHNREMLCIQHDLYAAKGKLSLWSVGPHWHYA